MCATVKEIDALCDLDHVVDGVKVNLVKDSGAVWDVEPFDVLVRVSDAVLVEESDRAADCDDDELEEKDKEELGVTVNPECEALIDEDMECVLGIDAVIE